MKRRDKWKRFNKEQMDKMVATYVRRNKLVPIQQHETAEGRANYDLKITYTGYWKDEDGMRYHRQELEKYLTRIAR